MKTLPNCIDLFSPSSLDGKPGLRPAVRPRFRATRGKSGGLVAPIRGLGINAFFIGLPKPSKTSVPSVA
jgi:hypothetical protein